MDPSGLPQNTVFLFHIADSQPIDFVEIFNKPDEQTRSSLDEITKARTLFLNAFNQSDVDYAIKCTEEYLPHLFGLIEEAKQLPKDTPVPRLKISWTSSLGSKYNKRFFTSDHWHYEVVNCLLVYGMLYRIKAGGLLSGFLNIDEYKEKSNQVVQSLCTAAGIFDYIKKIELSRWTHKPSEPLPEKYTEYYTILSTLCIAESQQVAIKKGFLSGMSKKALSKLCMDVCSKYRYLSGILLSPGFCDTFVMPQITSYCAFNDHLYELFAFRLLGTAAMDEDYGIAVGYLGIGLQRAQNFDKIPSDKTADAVRMRQFFEFSLSEYSKIYSQVYSDNSRIYFARVPSVSQLELPKAVCIAKPIPWNPPEPIPIKITLLESSSCLIM